jgi:group I intron endonuclease
MQAYLITNKINNKGYVGITTRSLDRRWYEHRFVANSCGQLLAKAINKYGEQAFEIMPIASAKTLENLKEVEKDLIVQFQTKVPFGYNLTDGGDGVFGFKQSEEQKKRNGDLKRGTKASEETKAKMRVAHSGEKNHFYGKNHTEEAKRKNAEAHIGKTGHWAGKARNEETKKKISESLKGKAGRPHTEEAKQKISNAHKGKKQAPPSLETRKKLSLATKKYWEAKKQNERKA